MKQGVSFREPKIDALDYRVSNVEAHHRQLDERLKELGRRAYLTPGEQKEIAELKKHKLKVKDELVALRRGA